MSSQSVREYIEKVETLPSLPGVVVRLLASSDDETTSAEDIGEILSSDPAMTAHLLRLTNLSLYSLKSEVRTVHRAVAILGLKAVRCLALGAGLLRTFPEDAGDGAFSIRHFWRHSLACALSGRMLAEKAPELDADELFTAGLLHDLGRALLYQNAPDAYAKLVARSQETGTPLLALEAERFGVSHTDAGKWLAQHWGLPELYVQTAWLHHQPPDSLSREVFNTRAIHVVQLANRLARRQLLDPGTALELVEPEEALLKAAGFDAAFVAEVEKQVIPALNSHAALFDMDCTEDVYHDAFCQANRTLSRIGVGMSHKMRLLERSERCFHALHEMNASLASRQSVSEVLEAVAKALHEGYGVSAGACALPLTSAGLLCGRAWRHPKKLEEFQLALEEETTSKTPGLLEDTVVRDFLLNTTRHWNNGSPPIGAASDVVRSSGVLMAPILLSEGAIGCLLVDQRMEDPESAFLNPREDMMALASAAALALSRVRLIQACEARSEELASVLWKKEEIQKQLIRSERLAAVGKMAAGAAHEVNNPLAIISGRAQILQHKAKDPEWQKQLSLIVDQAARASKTLNDLMRFARPTLPRKVAERVNVVISEVVEMFETQFRNHGLSLETNYGEGLPRILVNRKQIQQVLVNLLINADHATEGSGTVTVKSYAGKKGKQVCIDVRDTGCGIARELQGKIFEPFFSTKEEGKGTGLGLSLAHGILASHQGTISVKSAPNKGAAFTISLPAIEGQEGTLPTPAVTESPVTVTVPVTVPEEAPKPRILVVDDEEQVRAIISEALSSQGYEITHATNGNEAIEAVRANPPDLLTLDIRMPRVDGMSVLRTLQKLSPGIPVIVVTGLAGEEEENKARELGAVAFLRKPFEVGSLLAEVEQALSASGS
jgi:signal transduction histidine kinase/HD-like signal output (HDOD) protein/ActR/RegA family two-component response regulator